ncbi:MAG TPA: TIGR00730 family Rossman fold protein [Chthoniobacteraceae bacterium]|jgi:hypothetical protein
MQDFTAGGIAGTPNKTQTTGSERLDERVKQLVADYGCEKSNDLVEEMIITALKLGRDQTTTADLKLFNRSLKELRYAARMFAPYRGKKKIVVFGSARTADTEPEALAAEAFSRKMVEHGYMIITGGGDGIMGAAQRGAGREQSFGLNIRLPFEQRANETIHGDTKLVNFNYFFTRKLNFVKETHGIALFPGGFGTMDEGFEVLTLMQTGKARIFPVVLVDKPGGRYWETWFAFLSEHLLKLGLVSEEDFNFFESTHDVDEAVEMITRFYKNFRSYRWVGPRMVVRLTTRLTADAVTKLNAEFTDILQTGEIVQTTALPQEANEPELAQYPRLVFQPHQRNFGRLRILVNAINAAETE